MPSAGGPGIAGGGRTCDLLRPLRGGMSSRARAHLPIETYDACHDAIVDRLSSLMDEAGFRPRTEPPSCLIPPAVLLAPALGGGGPASYRTSWP